MKNFLERCLIRIFVDNLTLDKYWRCHQMPERSFFVRGRQFHLCARCTGILVGYCLSPIFGLLIREKSIVFFIVSTSIMALDGFTQLWKLRESTNFIRLLTGLGFGLTLPPFCVAILIKIFLG